MKITQMNFTQMKITLRAFFCRFLILVFGVMGGQITYGNGGLDQSVLNDALGRKILGGANRVISLSPAITELLFDLKQEGKIIGVSEFSDFPKTAQKLPRVGPYSKPDLEKILSLNPDLVILAIEGPEDIHKRLEQVHIPYAVTSMRTLSEIGSAATQIGSWVGATSRGVDYEKSWNRKLNTIFEKVKKNKNLPKVLIEIQHEPLIVAGQGTFLDEIAGKCGGENIFHEIKGYPRIALEAVSVRPVDIILVVDHFEKKSEQEKTINAWKKFYPTRKAKIEALDPDRATRPGPRLIAAIEDICKIIQIHSPLPMKSLTDGH